ncbi:MAG TPA: 1,2-phenylacetyl-CoA epoxidase subunit PaaD [Burkholderiaceae bacterium]|nr:1,2-phenylacetyl-CoA epoxidase subunit PaaD [Burkholderiaceae bacterium]
MTATVEQVWHWLEEVPDPEIPVISVVDLGIVRKVERGGNGEFIVIITPTYSGCPAMLTIADGVEAVLRSHGVERVRLETQLSPAWTTDWMTESGKKKLKHYGIAPPARQASDHQVIDISRLRKASMEPAVECPRCGSTRTHRTSEFGSTSCKALYRCDDCLEPFDYFKSH